MRGTSIFDGECWKLTLPKYSKPFFESHKEFSTVGNSLCGSRLGLGYFSSRICVRFAFNPL